MEEKLKKLQDLQRQKVNLTPKQLVIFEQVLDFINNNLKTDKLEFLKSLKGLKLNATELIELETNNDLLSAILNKFKEQNKKLEQISKAEGPRGEKGDRGPKGDKGDKGNKGDKGDKGDRGNDGKNGKDGKDGKDGKNGKDGKQGKVGPKGPRGERGPQGPKGKDGKNGKDGITTVLREVKFAGTNGGSPGIIIEENGFNRKQGATKINFGYGFDVTPTVNGVEVTLDKSEDPLDLTLQEVTDNGATTTNKITITGEGLDTQYVQFDTTYVPNGEPVGSMYWNDQEGTVDVQLKGGSLNLQVGQENVIRVVNKTNSNLLKTNYDVVRIRKVSEGGAQGQRLAIKLAQADSEPNSTDVIGLVAENINNNQEGFITTFGEVKDINTTGSLQGETWTDGDILYVSPTTAGRLTNVKPSAPNHLIIVGYVVYAHNNQGKIFINLHTSYELEELHNVKIDSVGNGEILQYKTSSGLWENQTLAEAKIVTPIEVTVSTATGTVAKVGTTTNGNYIPAKGDLLLVNFTNGNSAVSPTLNIDGSGAKNIRLGTTDANAVTFTISGNVTVPLWYDGTFYQIWGSYRTTDTDTDTTYKSPESFTSVTGTSQAITVQRGYIANNATTQINFTLPATHAIGDIVEIIGFGAGGYRITSASGDNIILEGNSTNTAGYIAGGQYTSVGLRCVVANTTWEVVFYTGKISTDVGYETDYLLSSTANTTYLKLNQTTPQTTTGTFTFPRAVLLFDNDDYGVYNTGENAHLALLNPNGSQNIVDSIIGGVNQARWRTDNAGNISWVAFATDADRGHYFYVGGDYPTGDCRQKISPNGTAIGNNIVNIVPNNPLEIWDNDGNDTYKWAFDTDGSIKGYYISTPSNPNTDETKLYFKSDFNLYKKDDTGYEQRISGRQQRKTTYVNDNYTIDGVVDDFIAVDTQDQAMAITITLSTTDVLEGDVFTFKDVTGTANTYNITIDADGNTIDGQATYVMTNAYQSIDVLYYQGNWVIM